MANGIATNVFMGTCYNRCVCSGGMTTHGKYYVVADDKPLAKCWQMLQPCGRMRNIHIHTVFLCFQDHCMLTPFLLDFHYAP